MGRGCPTEPLRDYRKTTSERKEEKRQKLNRGYRQLHLIVENFEMTFNERESNHYHWERVVNVFTKATNDEWYRCWLYLVSGDSRRGVSHSVPSLLLQNEMYDNCQTKKEDINCFPCFWWHDLVISMLLLLETLFGNVSSSFSFLSSSKFISWFNTMATRSLLHNISLFYCYSY